MDGRNVKNTYCTLFDINYLDKGTLLIESLSDVTKSDFKIYVLAMDDQCYSVLNAMYSSDSIVVIRLMDFENTALLQAKQNRSFGEYCWTCTASLIEYVFNRYGEEFCTYVDADMLFYYDPSCLIDEMIVSGKSVQLIEHAFKKDFWGDILLKECGRYCVEFNTFRNDHDGRQLLSIWVSQTLASAKADTDNGHLGDQYYLDRWADEYDCVNVIRNLGAGLAPWNLNRYSMRDGVIFCDNTTIVDLIFYHFHDLREAGDGIYDISVYKRYWKIDKQLVNTIYRPYLKALMDRKNMLRKEYGVLSSVKSHPGYKEKSRDMAKIVKRILGLRGGVWIRRYISAYLKKEINGKNDLIMM